MRFSAVLAASVLLAAMSGVAAAAPPTAKIDKIEIRLIYTTTGAFSQDIADPAGFAGWNTIIAGGDAKEPANDVLVQVHLKMDQLEGNLALPLTIDVRGERAGNNNKPGLLGKHACRAIYFREGRSVCSFIVRAATCSGRVTVKAAIGTERKNVGVTLRCGE